MDLDNHETMQTIDRDHMLSHINALPDQLEQAWQAAQEHPLPNTHRQPRQIVLCGMGGSAIGGDLAAALVSSSAPAPFVVVRGYDLPAYVTGPDALVILSSHSGNTEETLSAAAQAIERGVQTLAITTGGKLAAHARQHAYLLWLFDYVGQPRAALGWSFGLLVGLAHRLGLASDLKTAVSEAVDLLRRENARFGADSPVTGNPAKRGAGQLMGRIPVIYGGGIFEPVARRWKCQFNENSKVWAQFEALPEANHNAVVGWEYPDDLISHMAALFITSRQHDHPRVGLRHELTFKMCLQNAIMADIFQPEGTSKLAQMMHAIQYGDYVSYYMAIGYGVDPTAIEPLVELKHQLAQRT